MVAVQIRDVSEETRDALVQLAAAKGQSLQAFLLDRLDELALRQRRLALLNEFDARTDGAMAMSPDEVPDLIRAAREERDERLLGHLDETAR